MLRSSIPALVLSIACSGPAEMPGVDGGRPALSVVPTGFTATSLVDADAGATITLEAGARTYVLEITPNALSTDTEITLEGANGGAQGPSSAPTPYTPSTPGRASPSTSTSSSAPA